MNSGADMPVRCSAIVVVASFATFACACSGGVAPSTTTGAPGREPPSGGREPSGSIVEPPGSTIEPAGSTREDPGPGESNGTSGGSGSGCLPCDETIFCNGTPVVTLSTQNGVCIAQGVGAGAAPSLVVGCDGTITSPQGTATITQLPDGTLQVCSSGGNNGSTICLSCTSSSSDAGIVTQNLPPQPGGTSSTDGG
jgi:hypothetical protein